MKGANLTINHQRAAGRRNVGPRIPGRSAVARKANPDESLDDATLRLQQAKADTEQLDAEKREVELAALRRELIPAPDARDAIEAVHLQWVAELEQLPHSVATALPPEVPASLREVMRAAVEAQCNALRTRIGGG